MKTGKDALINFEKAFKGIQVYFSCKGDLKIKYACKYTKGKCEVYLHIPGLHMISEKAKGCGLNLEMEACQSLIINLKKDPNRYDPFLKAISDQNIYRFSSIPDLLRASGFEVVQII